MFVASLSFLAGVALVQISPQLPPMALILGLLLAGLLTLRARRIGLACFLLGLFWACLQGALALRHALPTQWEGQDLRVEGQVEGLPERAAMDGLRFAFRIEAVYHDGHRQPFRLPVRLHWYRKPASLDVDPGQSWQLVVRLKRPHGFANPGGFDYERWLFQSGYRATGYVRRDIRNQRVPKPALAPVQDVRQRIQARLRERVQQSPTGALLEALTLGVRERMQAHHWQVLRRTGTSHLMAISGLHVGLVAAALYGLVSWLWSRYGDVERWPAQQAASWAALSAALVYGALAGFSIPTRRAVLMVAVVLLALLWRRSARPLAVLALALWAVLLMDPLAVLAQGFWLSFAAVAVLLLLYTESQRGTSYWRRLARMQWVLSLGLAPLVLGFFQEISLVAPLTNLLAVPWVGLVVVPLALLGALFALWLPDIAGYCWWLADTFLQVLWHGLVWAANLPGSSWTRPPVHAWAWCAMVAAVALLLGARSWALRLLALPLLLPLLFSTARAPPAGALWFDLLDVGQGLAAVVRTHRHVLVYDTGPAFPSGFNTGEAVLLPFLRSQGIDGVDRLIVSHGDMDHRGGAQSLYRHMPVYSLLSSVPERLPWARSKRCLRGQRWAWDGVEFAVLGPQADGASGNNGSCVLRVQAGEHVLLLPGDIEATAERSLVKREGEGLAASILVAPHHGSATSSSADFLAAVRPQWVLYPVGYRNRWGFPRAEVAARYDALGARALSTAREGTIHLRLRPGLAPRASTQRRQRRRYWQRPL